MQTIKTQNGKYTRLQLVDILSCGAQVYNALYIKNDGYTEKRVCTVKNKKVLAWQSQYKIIVDNCVYVCYYVHINT